MTDYRIWACMGMRATSAVWARAAYHAWRRAGSPMLGAQAAEADRWGDVMDLDQASWHDDVTGRGDDT